MYVNSHTESFEDLPGVYYAWVENINQKEGVELMNTNTGLKDENYDNAWTINMAQANTGNLEYMREMGKMLYEKKKLDKRLRILNA